MSCTRSQTAFRVFQLEGEDGLRFGQPLLLFGIEGGNGARAFAFASRRLACSRVPIHADVSIAPRMVGSVGLSFRAVIPQMGEISGHSRAGEPCRPWCFLSASLQELTSWLR
jgi:hypothetical protein